MSDYGMLITNASGQTRLNISDKVFRLVTSFTVNAGVSGSVTIAGLSGKSPVAFASVVNQTTSQFVLPHNVSFNGDVVSYAPGIRNGNSIIWIYATT
jgi:hypothetical protein